MDDKHFEEVSEIIAKKIENLKSLKKIKRRTSNIFITSIFFPHDESLSIKYNIQVHITRKDYKYFVVDKEYRPIEEYLDLYNQNE